MSSGSDNTPLSSHKKFYDFRVEDWYSCCYSDNKSTEPLTFTTDFLSLTIEQANAIIHLYELFHKYPRQLLPGDVGLKLPEQDDLLQQYIKNAKVKCMNRFSSVTNVNSIVSEFYDWDANNNNTDSTVLKNQKIFTRQDAVLIQQLGIALQQKFDELAKVSPYPQIDGFFVRASTRSPKDGCLRHRQAFTQQLKLELEKNAQQSGREVTFNEPLAVVRAFNAKLCVQNALQALDLLVNSERIYADLFRALLFIDENLKKEPQKELPEQRLVVRLFKKMSRPEYEFRVFVKYFENLQQHQVVGITQYFKTCYLEDLNHHDGSLREQIQNGIQELAQEVSKRLQTTENFVLDVSIEYEHVLSEDGTNSQFKVTKIWMIEINSFSKQASPCLFNWDEEETIKVLSGELPLQFRILQKPLTLKEGRRELAKDVSEMLELINGKPPVENGEVNHQDDRDHSKKNCMVQ
ncbi:hypothetical protein C9374_010001 [Naegleria lovaniensis]|uniref:Uncharacterized protein n=1 Tax=Naegleria lovaniensis TaxID=51637 RepID=A0AA88KEW5_NAELO|nr:uncharacterized protein C9374_010001 [Naegleria lovaniensis]KAG2375378.1 hypothetical protein C9374_010001 [Naegleria lovaniensis]